MKLLTMRLKKISAVFFALAGLMLILPFQSAKAVDQETIQALKKQGFEVRMGELTGAGSRLSLKRLAGFIHPNGIVMKQDCQAITVSRNGDPADPKISDVTKVQVNENEISSREFEGFFIK
jgi:hypothetical protein